MNNDVPMQACESCRFELAREEETKDKDEVVVLGFFVVLGFLVLLFTPPDLIFSPPD